MQSQASSGLRHQHDSRFPEKDSGTQPKPGLENLPGFLGTQILAEYYACDPTVLSDSSLVEKIMVEAARDAGATVVGTSFHQFSPHGVSGVVIIEESHLGIHTWPEFGFAAVDLFTCGDSVNPWKAYESLKSSLKANQGTFMELRRGHRGLIENS
ncbi:adenosylmethionine decarboxylase [bacterium]|nr:adenosylmethionine decarboxylase [bacterium]